MCCLQAKLRIGLAEQSVLVALAHAATLHADGLGKGKKVGNVKMLQLLRKGDVCNSMQFKFGLVLLGLHPKPGVLGSSLLSSALHLAPSKKD